ncbi:LLM class flavin-dependent oxidoreductase [Frankia sp. Ag45/Mut15]|uniref:LLM class flavin-dependent oxidoreductase n=1 Tax=Frankia umida TaxID=573489 RepID=A0ABT0K0S2_9ACTN|nr:LLM class flavin-dependent oxidoreductase [Frankia umida]MCK9877134.1 LLM class flavin-dependent oxidoreductase [Frankia umida]
MKLDLLYEFQPKIGPYAEPFPHGQKKAEQQTYQEALAEISYADTLGFQTAWVVEHHFRQGRSASPSNEAVLAALSQRTRNIRLGFGVVLLPAGFQHPVRVAEKVATVDLLSGGRVEWGTGRSTPNEQLAFGVPADDRSRELWQEAFEFVIAAWTNEKLSWKSPSIDFPERFITPRPYQDPHPPAWLAAASETSAFNAGRLGLGLLSFALMQPVSKMAEHIATYRRGQAECITPLPAFANDRVGAYTLVHCTDDPEEAARYGLWDSVRWWYQNLAEFTLEWELAHLSAEEKAQVFPLLEPTIRGDIDIRSYTEQDMVIIGTPEECLEKILRYEQAGVDQLLCYTQFGTLPHEKVLRSIELLGTKVIPELENRGHRVDYEKLFGGV